jgi:hypothetical protein
MKSLKDPSGIEPEFPACSEVPQRTALPRNPPNLRYLIFAWRDCTRQCHNLYQNSERVTSEASELTCSVSDQCYHLRALDMTDVYYVVTIQNFCKLTESSC